MAGQVRGSLSALGIACSGLCAVAATPSVAQTAGRLKARSGPREEPVPGQYIVTLRDDSATPDQVNASSAAYADRNGGEVLHVYTAALHGFAVRLSAQQAREVAADPSVAAVEEDGIVRAATDATVAAIVGPRSNRPA